MTTSSKRKAQKRFRRALVQVANESGIYKNFISEAAQKGGCAEPTYDHISSGPDHDPTLQCTLKLGELSFEGEPAKTMREAERNAAIAALALLKQCKISLGASSLDWTPSCPCGHGYMIVKTSRSKATRGRQFWFCPSTNGKGGCGRRIWRHEVWIEDIFQVEGDDAEPESDEFDDIVDKLIEEFQGFSASMKCDVAKVLVAVDNLKEEGRKSVEEIKTLKRDVATKVQVAIDNLKEGRKLSASVLEEVRALKHDVAKVHVAIDNLKEERCKLAALVGEINFMVSVSLIVGLVLVLLHIIW